MNLRPVALRPALAISVYVEPLIDLGGGRRMIPFSGGTFTGRDGLEGVLAAGGVDWQQNRPDGTLEIDAHYLLQTEADERIEVRSIGLRKAAPDVADRLSRREPVDPDEYYFRTAIRLLTTASRLSHLNDALYISTGQRDRDVVHIHVHEVL
jgi:hypothetical protein